MKIKNYVISFLFIFIFFLTFTIKVSAASYVGTLTADEVNFRKGPGTNYGSNGYLYLGYTVSLDSTSLSTGTGCSSGWYHATYNGTDGYICSDYVSVRSVSDNNTATTSCEQEMANAGFPSSYWDGLCALKSAHPNWQFKAIQTNLDWQTVIDKESSCGKSLVQTSNSEYIDNTCSSGYGSWKPASKKAVAFYMDPRNFLTEQYIFQFEYLKYVDAASSAYIKSVDYMLSSSSFYIYHRELGHDFASIVNDAGKGANVNPVSIAARMRQEMGNSTTLYNLYSGVYGENNNLYYGYYNFFNIGVSDSCVNTYGTTYCGLSYAKDHGWNSLYSAIKGGADFLGQDYIAVGQYTTYLQKYNVVPTNSSSLFVHQYMTNIAAPSSESTSTYNTYKNLGLLDTAFEFYIPVYSNMDETIDNSGSGAVDQGDTGNSNNNNNSNNTISVNTVVVSAGYKYSSTSISGISATTTVNTLKNNLESLNGSGTVTIQNSNGTTVSDGLLATGQKVTIKNANGNQTLTVIVKGDTSGDGKITVLDLLQVQKAILGTGSLSGAYKNAADTSGDGKVTVLDLLQIQKSILNGTYKI